MARRAFSFNIPKPLPYAIGVTPLQIRLYDELQSRYPSNEAGVPSEEAYDEIITKLYPTGFDSREIKFDRGFSRQTEQRVLSVSFGDGYEQRVKDGINTKKEMYNMNLSNRLWQEIVLIGVYFDTIQPSSFNITLERETVLVSLKSYSINIGHDSVQSISAQLKRVYSA
jgi:phage-related protein